KMVAVSALAGHAPHADDGRRQGEVRRLRAGPDGVPGDRPKPGPRGDGKGDRFPLIFEINEFRCIFCGYCQEVCTEEAIHVGRPYENAEYSREGFVYDLERLTAQTHPVCEMWDPADPLGEG